MRVMYNQSGKKIWVRRKKIIKVTVLLVLLLVSQPAAHGELALAGSPGEIATALSGVEGVVTPSGLMPEALESMRDEETYFFGQLLAELLLSSQCEVIREFDEIEELSVRVSL